MNLNEKDKTMIAKSKLNDIADIRIVNNNNKSVGIIVQTERAKNWVKRYSLTNQYSFKKNHYRFNLYWEEFNIFLKLMKIAKLDCECECIKFS